jgi:hypothetical protein
MDRKHFQHAAHVVDTFKEKLSESGRHHVGEKHFDELALLIESAISTAVLEEMERAANKLDQVASEMRNNAEHI